MEQLDRISPVAHKQKRRLKHVTDPLPLTNGTQMVPRHTAVRAPRIGSEERSQRTELKVQTTKVLRRGMHDKLARTLLRMNIPHKSALRTGVLLTGTPGDISASSSESESDDIKFMHRHAFARMGAESGGLDTWNVGLSASDDSSDGNIQTPPL